MAKSQTFTITTDWAAVQLDAVDIKDGTFTVFNKGGGRIESIFGNSIPTASNGDVFTNEGKESDKIALSGADRWYVKTDTGEVTASVIQA